MTYDYDYLLAGSTGQIGRPLLEQLSVYGRVCTMERDTLVLPRVKHVVNAGGYTRFDDSIDSYWRDNVRLAVRLASWARETGAYYHQLSSEAVAEYHHGVLPEALESPVAHPKMIDYALSKVLTEAAVRSIVPSRWLSIYRCCDAVPPPGSMAQEWRRNHWLAILFGAGPAGFAQNDDFPVWIASATDLAGAITLLVRRGQPGAYHLLGHQYLWRHFYAVAVNSSTDKKPWASRLVDKVTPVIRIHPPLASCISDEWTYAILKNLGFKWEFLHDSYWSRFAELAAESQFDRRRS